MRDFAWRAGRAEVELPVELATDADTFAAACKNISPGGLFVATDRLCDVGTQVAVKLSLPEQPRPMSVSAEVRWRREPVGGAQLAGMGLRFVNPPIGVLIAIHELLEARE